MASDFDVLYEVFPDLTRSEFDDLRRDRFAWSQMIDLCFHYLQNNGVKFGCGIRCYPGCTC